MNRNLLTDFVNIDIVFSISGRLRLRVEMQPIDPLFILNELKKSGEIVRGSYNDITNNFLLEYDCEEIDAKSLILKFCGLYSKQVRISNMKVNFKLCKRKSLGYSSALSLSFILLDLGINYLGLMGNVPKYKNFIRWCALGTTIGAIFEHGHRELNENGAFDPEVMSIMYLINSINKGTVMNNNGMQSGLYSPAIAWVLTFGRHILTNRNQSIIISTLIRNGEIKVIEENNKTFFFNQFLGSCFDVYQNVNVKKSLGK